MNTNNVESNKNIEFVPSVSFVIVITAAEGFPVKHKLLQEHILKIL